MEITLIHIIISSMVFLCLGSAIGVYVIRTPEYEEHQWRKEAHAFLEQPFPETEIPPPSFSTGRSRCPKCNTKLTLLDLIPLLSFLINRQRCRHCHAPIPWFYFAIEIATLLLCLPLLWIADSQPELVLISLIFCCLLTISLIDWRHQWIPDQLTLFLLGLALIHTMSTAFVSLESSVIAMLAGYIFVVAIRQIYLSIRKIEAIGIGDAKLLAALGAWQGVDAMFAIVFIASSLGIIYAITYKKSGKQAIAFGPFLCIGAAIHFYLIQLNLNFYIHITF